MLGIVTSTPHSEFPLRVLPVAEPLDRFRRESEDDGQNYGGHAAPQKHLCGDVVYTVTTRFDR